MTDNMTILGFLGRNTFFLGRVKKSGRYCRCQTGCTKDIIYIYKKGGILSGIAYLHLDNIQFIRKL